MPLTSPRLKVAVAIRPVDKRDTDSIQRFASDTQLHAMCSLPSPYPEDGATAFVAEARVGWQRNTQCTFAIVSHEAFCGLVTLDNVRGGEGTASLGYWVASQHWGKGIATEASRLAVRYAFTRLFLQTLCSQALARNSASR